MEHLVFSQNNLANQEQGADENGVTETTDDISPRPLRDSLPPTSASADVEVDDASSDSAAESVDASTKHSSETATLATSQRDSASTQHRLSQTSNLEAVSLEDEKLVGMFASVVKTPLQENLLE